MIKGCRSCDSPESLSNILLFSGVITSVCFFDFGDSFFLHRNSAVLVAAELYDQGVIKARSYEQTEVFEAAELFARCEGILPAPESSHAIKGALDEALKCKESGEAKNIVFGLTGTGYFDMVAYQQYNDGTMTDYIPTDEDLAEGFKTIPQFPGNEL
jgi:tryptophan synthase beta chain